MKKIKKIAGTVILFSLGLIPLYVKFHGKGIFLKIFILYWLVLLAFYAVIKAVQWVNED